MAESVCWVPVLTDISTEGRALEVFINDPAGLGPVDTLLMGAFHGDEPESAVLTRYFLEHVTPPQLHGRRIAVFPVVNPDGLAKKQRTTSQGVDLNRNFPTKDWVEQGADTIYYSGPNAASEPETRFLLKILDLLPPAKIISVHTPYRVINYDGPARTLADVLADVIGYPVVEDIGYPTPGSFGTYVGKERQIPTLTLELPEADFDQAELEKNFEGLLAVIAADVATRSQV